MRHIERVSVLSLLLLATAAAPTWAQSVDKGKAAYFGNGCWQCHGFVGQGGVTGPKLAPETKPLAYFAAFIRNTNGTMPPYSEKLLSKDELADIVAYLKSLPAGPDFKSIPLLN